MPNSHLVDFDPPEFLCLLLSALPPGSPQPLQLAGRFVPTTVLHPGMTHDALTHDTWRAERLIG